MLIKRNIALTFQRMYFHLKNLHWNFFIPILIADIFLPFICLITYISERTRMDFAYTVMSFSLILIPFCSVWWAIFINRDYIEGQGNELLFVCRNKIKTMDTLIPFVLFFAFSIIQFAFYAKVDSDLKYESIKLLCICFFYYCLVQFMVFLTKSISITLLIVLCYTIANPILTLTANRAVFPIYYDVMPLCEKTFLHLYFPLFVLGSVFLIISIILNKKRLKFN